MSQRNGFGWRRSRFLRRIHGQMENYVKKNDNALIREKNLQITVIANNH